MNTTTMLAKPSVLVVIVNYRCSGLTIDCLRTLERQVAAWPAARVVVTDNRVSTGTVVAPLALLGSVAAMAAAPGRSVPKTVPTPR